MVYQSVILVTETKTRNKTNGWALVLKLHMMTAYRISHCDCTSCYCCTSL